MTPWMRTLQGIPVRRSERIRLQRETAWIKELERRAEQAGQEQPEPQTELQPEPTPARRNRTSLRGPRGGGVRKRKRRAPRQNVAAPRNRPSEEAFAHFECFMEDIIRMARECIVGQEEPGPSPLARQDQWGLETEQELIPQENIPVNEELDIVLTMLSSSDDELG